MTTWVTSDLHFGHANILKFNPATRKYETIDEMNERFIQEWNTKVAPDDTVFILGDFAFLAGEKAADIAMRLFGKKVLIVGNHDKKLLQSDRFRKQFKDIRDYLEVDYTLEDPRPGEPTKPIKLVMFHFPIAEWNQCHRGAVHLYGHLHGAHSGLENYRAVDVGVDSGVFGDGAVVRKMDDVVGYALTGEIKTHGSD
jgi:calcineurin-like phosphoesterase family protein